MGLEQLREIEDKAILDALELQREIGLDIFTDGEYRRSNFQADLPQWVDGFTTERVTMEWSGPNAGPVSRGVWVVAQKLQQRQRITLHETTFMKEHSLGPVKITIPSAALILGGAYKPGVTDQFYPTRYDLLRDLVEIIHGEVSAVVDEGVSYVQIDAPNYGFYLDEKQRQLLRDAGVDPDRELDEAIAADNACLEGVRRDGVTLAIHFCRGNNRSRWIAEGGYDPIAEKLFGSLDVDTFLLEYDTERAGGFEPLRFVPRGKTVVLGLLTTKDGRLESQDVLLRRIEDASRYVPLEDLALSPQCGFASVNTGNLLSRDEQRRKLEMVVDTARKVWG